MAHAIGCLGSSVATYRAERAKSVRRKVDRKALTHGPRNQDRVMTFAVISRPEEKGIKVIRVRKGHLNHVKAAYLYGKVEYLALDKVAKAL